jgi:hypothetical protein
MVLTLAYYLTEVPSALDFGNPRNVMLAFMVIFNHMHYVEVKISR